MNMRGRIRGGKIELDSPISLPDGAEVAVEIHPLSPPPTESAVGESLAQRLADVIGAIDDLPPDFAQQHDHYVHGTPRR